MTEQSDTDTAAPTGAIDRREFMTLLALAAASYPLPLLAEKRAQAAATDTEQPLTEPWLTLSAVQQHLFPAEVDSPGASDINALGYLQHMLEAPDMDTEERDFITRGPGWLNDMARKQHNAPFIELDETGREQVLRDIERSRAGQRWLSLLLSYILEALLSDPVYGGNPDGIGWKWLEHQPGYPTPPKDRMYYKLASRRSFRSTRA